MLSYFEIFLIFLCGIIVAGDDTPVISCTFSASILSRVQLPDGTYKTTEYEHYSIAKKKFLQSGMIMDWYPRNMTALFEQPNKYTFIQPFFDRKICTVIPFRSIIPCFVFPQNATKVASRVPCATDPALDCDSWQYKDTELWSIRSDSNPPILDQIVIKDNSLNMKATSFFRKFDPTEPDPSIFAIPKDQPCANLINSEEDKFNIYHKNQPEQSKRRIDMVVPFPLSQDSIYSKEAIAKAVKEAPRKEYDNIDKKKTDVKHTMKQWKFGDDIPEEYDTTVNYAQCGTGTIVDQGSCSSSWAVAAARTLSDRYCITQNTSLTFSPQWMVSCHNDQLDCRGGFPDKAFMDLKDYGIVTEECFPYSGTPEKCPTSCIDGSQLQVYKLKTAYTPYKKFDVKATMELIQQDILLYGPVTAGLWTFGDFRDYTGGIYEHNSSTGVISQHTVRIVGWGVDQNTKKPFWKVANSWGDTWGEKGYFRILRGTDECAIEDQIASGLF